jgi:integrin alpha FG-GAP repeat containing protein 1
MMARCATDCIGKYRYTASQTLASSSKILNVVPGDFNHDGRLDLLVMSEEKEGSWWNNEESRTKMQVHLGEEGGGFGMSFSHRSRQREADESSR